MNREGSYRPPAFQRLLRSIVVSKKKFGKQSAMKVLILTLTAAAGMLVCVRAAPAQGAPPPPGAPPPAESTAQDATPYNDASCGSWQGDTWTANGNCPSTAYKHAVVAGTITFVKGHLVTLQQTNGQIVIDDSAALNDQTTGRVAVGRQVVAHGYWRGGNFYATAITGGQPPPPPGR
jgi:hypothetical protein